MGAALLSQWFLTISPLDQVGVGWERMLLLENCAPFPETGLQCLFCPQHFLQCMNKLQILMLLHTLVTFSQAQALGWYFLLIPQNHTPSD